MLKARKWFKKFSKLLGASFGFVLALSLAFATETVWLSTPKLSTADIKTYSQKCYSTAPTALVEDTYFYYDSFEYSGYAGKQQVFVTLKDEDGIGNADDTMKKYIIYFENGYPVDHHIDYVTQEIVDTEGDNGAELYVNMKTNVGSNGPNGMFYYFGIN